MRLNFGQRGILAMLLALVFCFTGTAYAQSAPTWLPSYDPATKIYVDPALANDATAPVSFDADFRAQLAAEAAKNNLDIYVIATKQGSDLTGESRSWAPELLHTPLWNKWTASSAFSERDKVVILWVRYANDPTRNSIGVRVGSRLHALGIDRNRLSDPNGPVITGIKAHIPGDGAPAALLAIASNINAEVAQRAAPAPQAAVSNDDGGSGSGLLLLVLGLCGVAAVVLVIVLIARSGSSSSSYNSYSPPSYPRPGSTTGGGTRSGTGTSSTTSSKPSGSGLGTTGAIITGGVLGGLAGTALSDAAAKKAKERKKDSGSSGGSDSGTTTGGTSCSSGTTGSSCSSASCGGGSSCGGGGCGGGGCGGG